MSTNLIYSCLLLFGCFTNFFVVCSLTQSVLCSPHFFAATSNSVPLPLSLCTRTHPFRPSCPPSLALVFWSVAGVEDRLQEGVPTTLKGLQDAGIKIWMLTGDKPETAESIAKSSQLVKKMQEIYNFRSVSGRTAANLELNNFHRKNDCPLIIKGEDLEIVLKFYPKEFMEIACHCPAVVCCRCSPTQKAEVVRLIQTHTKRRCCAIGDGGNDVSMIQTADVGLESSGRKDNKLHWRPISPSCNSATFTDWSFSTEGTVTNDPPP